MAKIYTRGGDLGRSKLIGGQSVPKNHERLQAYGGCDELNCWLGWTEVLVRDLAQISESQNSSWNYSLANLGECLAKIQSHLFVIGGLMACEDVAFRKQLPQLPEDAVVWLEANIDEMSTHLPVLKNFILPGGSELSARLHLARSFCRRVERDIVSLQIQDPNSVTDTLIPYMNRLSDFLFTAARFANIFQGKSDTLWSR